jgi:FdhD protein
MEEDAGVPEAREITLAVECERFTDGEWTKETIRLPKETEITIMVDRREFVSILCTPTKLNFLVFGFLHSEGIIASPDDVLMMRVCDEEAEVDVRLTKHLEELPRKRRLTSGCGGGSTFSMEGKKIESDFQTSPRQVLSVMKLLQDYIDAHHLSGGIHTSALSDGDKLLVTTEDIGRHNTLDKILGESLMKGISTKDRLILTTGRVSSEMLLKAARMEAPVIVSRHTPTGTAVSMAKDLGITLAGKAGGSRLLVFSHPERLGRVLS